MFWTLKIFGALFAGLAIIFFGEIQFQKAENQKFPLRRAQNTFLLPRNKISEKTGFPQSPYNT